MGLDPLFVDDDEILLRRVPNQLVLPDRSGIEDAAMKPSTADSDGLSVFRASFHSHQDVAVTFRDKGNTPAWLAAFSAKDARARGLQIAAAPQPGREGHAVLSNLNAANRDTDQGVQFRRVLADLAGRPIGPFPPPPKT